MRSALTRSRIVIGLSSAIAAFGAVAACGTENPNDPAGQPSPSAPSSSVSSPAPSSPASPTPHGTPSTDCPKTIKAVQADLEKATWGKGLAKATFTPVSVTVCQYDAGAAGADYATVTTKRTQKASVDLFAMINSAKPVATKPAICTKDLGPTYVLRFTDSKGGVTTYVAEAFGCRRLVATSSDGTGKPAELTSPRQVSPQLLKSLGMR